MFFDLELTARTNGEFRAGLMSRLSQVNHFTDLAKRHAMYQKKANEALRDVLTYCNFNPGFLVSSFFPRYPNDKPLSFTDYPFSYAMFNIQVGGFTVIKGSRQISKSTSLAVRQLLNARMMRSWRSLYIATRIQYLKTYANKFRELEKASTFFTVDPQYRNNLCYKEYPNGSLIEMVYVLTTAGNIRSKSASELLYDEYQEFDPDLEIEVMQAQSASEMPVTIFAGTSLTTDTALEQKWNISSQGSWCMKCGCGHWNIPLREHGVLEMIQPDGPSCVKCARLLDVKRGRFLHANTTARDMGLIGYHVPQLIVPSVVYNKMRWAEIYNRKCKHGGDRKFFQEILGIATEDGEREITRQNLIDICTLGINLNSLAEKAQTRQYLYIVSGCDWGGSDYNPATKIKTSYTVHVMMGITATGEFHIIHFRRYAGMAYDDISSDIIANHKRLCGYAIASDSGVGAVYNSKLRLHIMAERHLMFTYVGPSSALINEPHGDHMFNQWSLNKTESISLTYDAVRSRRIRCYDWSIAEEYLTDFLNMYRAPGESTSGATTFLYRTHHTKPSDALHAVNYAFMLGKILLGEPMYPDLSIKMQLEQTLTSSLGYDHSGMFSVSG